MSSAAPALDTPEMEKNFKNSQIITKDHDISQDKSGVPGYNKLIHNRIVKIGTGSFRVSQDSFK